MSRISSMRELTAAEWLKLRTTRTTWGLAIAWLLCAAGPVVLVLLLVDTAELGTGEGDFATVTLFGAMVGLVMLIWGILGMAGEFRHGTITYTVLASPRRWHVIVLKLVFFFAFGCASALLALVLIQLLSVLIPPLRGAHAVTVQDGQLAYLGRVVLTTGLFAAFGVALASLLRSQVLTLSLTMVWVVAEQIIISPILTATGHTRAAAFLPLQVFSQVTGTPFNAGTGEGMPSVWTMSPGWALVVGIGYIAVAALAATFTTMRRDVT